MVCGLDMVLELQKFMVESDSSWWCEGVFGSSDLRSSSFLPPLQSDLEVMCSWCVFAMHLWSRYSNPVIFLERVLFYAPIRSTILTTKPLPTIKEAFSLMTIAKVNQIGSCKLTDKITIHDVLVVLSDQVSLLWGSQREGLYFLDVDKFFVKGNITMCLVSKCMWHNRPGHPANQVLSVLKDKTDLKGFQSSEPCELYHRAKQAMDSFPLKFITEHGGLNNLNFFDNQWPSEPYDDERNKNDSGCTNSSFADHAVEYASVDPTSTADLYASTSNKGVDSSDVSNLELDSTNKLDSINTEGGGDDDEALNRNNTWVVTDLPKGRKPIGCKWIFEIKYKSTGEIERYKAKLVAKGFRQKEGIDYEETFSPIVKMVTVRCVLNLVAQNDGSVYQLDIGNAFLYGELIEDVYISLLDGMLACKPSNIPLYVSKNKNKQAKLIDVDEIILDNITGYQKLVGKLIYLIITRSDISYVVHKLSQVMHAPKLVEMKSAFKVLRYIKHSSGTGIQYPKSDKFQGQSCVLESKRQTVLAKSSAEAEYKAILNVACEVIWILKILIELEMKYKTLVEMFCDNSSAM
nr:putative copia-type protein [Tanacetum cinerariifolium]